ncbi:hypothetical protein ACPV4W_04195 [Vibrio diabolicus]|uniref:hypothetical protein n=1 Tax=Vibrio diabolicus TaxID=50719 RepID=UPI003DB18990
MKSEDLQLLRKTFSQNEKLIDASIEYLMLKGRYIHPEGKFDNAKRWEPIDWTPSLGTIRAPSRSHPYSYLVHCRTKKRVSELRDVDLRELTATIKRISLFNLQLSGNLDEVKSSLSLLLSTYTPAKHSGNLKETSDLRIRQIKPYTIKRIHNKIQNGITESLRSTENTSYEKVDIEKDHIDIRALTTDKKWHYFEVKTDTVKMSIRKAIGQLLEYSLYKKDKPMAEKLIVVSYYYPTESDRDYIKNLRRLYSIPVYYAVFDLETETLHEAI